MIARIRARLRYMWGRRAIELGPLLITTREKASRREWNAFEVGCDHGAAHGPPPREESCQRHLRAV